MRGAEGRTFSTCSMTPSSVRSNFLTVASMASTSDIVLTALRKGGTRAVRGEVGGEVGRGARWRGGDEAGDWGRGRR